MHDSNDCLPHVYVPLNTSSLWAYFYGVGDAHRIAHISVAITTAATGIAIWLYSLPWDSASDSQQPASSSERYHVPLLASSLLSLCLAVCDVFALAKPEFLELVVRRAPTWEQLLAWRQRTNYFSLLRRMRSGVGTLRRRMRSDVISDSERAASGPMQRRHFIAMSERSITGGWGEGFVPDMVSQANPIEPYLTIIT